MAVLPDFRIREAVASGALGINPFRDEQLQPASYDMRLDRFFRTFPKSREGEPVDPREPDNSYDRMTRDDEPFLLEGFCLASTMEAVRVPSHMVGRVEGKSSLARLGLFVHVTAGFIDPGFEGFITLELFTVHEQGIILYPGMPVCQISFEKMTDAALHPYGDGGVGSKYQHAERGPTPSRYYKNFPLR